MTRFRKIALYGAISSAVMGLGSSVNADTLVLTFTDGTATTAKPGACSAIAWSAGREFRMCDTSGAALGGGSPLQKDSIFGGETYTFNAAGVLTGVTGTAGNPGTTPSGSASFPGSAAPAANSNDAWQQGAAFFGPAFNFLAPFSGSLAGTAYGNATYIGGVPVAGSNVPFIFAPVLEAQWGGTWFPLGQDFTGANGIDSGAGITFTADISNLSANTLTHVISFNFHMYANECIDGAGAGGCTTGGGGEDPGAAGFTGWTAQWHQQGSGSYTDTTAPSLSSSTPANGASNVSACILSYDITFNEPMAVSSVVSGAISISGGVTVGSPSATNSNKTFSFPITSGQLADSTLYTVQFNIGPTDFAGNALSPLPSDRTFTTAPPGCDITAPTITTRSPSSGATNVSITTTVAVTFDEIMSPGTANSITVVKTSDSSSVTGNVTTSDNTTFTFTPVSNLENSTQYTVTVAAATAEDASGNNLAADGTWSFTTEGEGQVIDRVLESNGQGNGLLAGCTMNPRAKFDPSLLAMLLGSFGFLIWRRKRRIKS